jgi:hypothetical protein
VPGYSLLSRRYNKLSGGFTQIPFRVKDANISHKTFLMRHFVMRQ